MIDDVFPAAISAIAPEAGAEAIITGGAGFIGARLCDLLRGSGWKVHSVGRRPIGPASAHRHWQVDLVDPAATHALVQAVRPDYVFHLAGHVWGAPDMANLLPTFHSNLQTTVNLLHSLAGGSCRRFVLAGSLVEPDVRSEEDVPPSPYAASKWASSDYVRMFNALYGLEGVIARLFMVYGPAQQDATKLVPYVIERLLRGEPPKITSGRHLIDWVYVDDVAAGLARIAVAANAAGRTVDLGSGLLLSTADLVQQIRRLMGSQVQPTFGALVDRPMEPTRVARTQETIRMLGWSPQTSIKEGLTRTISWHRARSSSSH